MIGEGRGMKRIIAVNSNCYHVRIERPVAGCAGGCHLH